jgi:hypothetical protein
VSINKLMLKIRGQKEPPKARNGVFKLAGVKKLV